MASHTSLFPKLAPGEGKKILGMVLLCFLASHVRRKTARKRWLGKADVEDKNTRWVDHPFIPYLLENSYIMLASIVFRRLAVLDHTRPVAVYFSSVLRSMATVITGLYFQRTCAEYLYSHVPYFTSTKPSADIKVIVQDYFRCNFVNDLMNGVLITALVCSPRAVAAREKLADKQFEIFPYLGKLLFGRVLVDIAFYLTHRWLHTDWAYKNIHARHHEHTAPRLQTNFHFEAIDLFLEAVAPFVATITIFQNCGITLSSFEEDMLGSTIFLFESGSHAGKELPVVTWFPPLSPIVDYFTKFDQRLIEYHTKHHMLYNCNYSISPWPDMLMGSYKMEYSVPKEPEKTSD